MTDRISSGAARLDSILGSGLPRNAICLVVGLPGSGKTILARQCVYANARVERPAIYCSTGSEPLEKILRFGQTLSFFDASAVGSRVIYDVLGSVLSDRGVIWCKSDARSRLCQRRPPCKGPWILAQPHL
ncbi:MAG: RAD55 family ATPase [Actinomycetes bacterium]